MKIVFDTNASVPFMVIASPDLCSFGSNSTSNSNLVIFRKRAGECVDTSRYASADQVMTGWKGFLSCFIRNEQLEYTDEELVSYFYEYVGVNREEVQDFIERYNECQKLLCSPKEKNSVELCKKGSHKSR